MKERIVRRVASQGEYVPISFSELKKGDVFFLDEPDGTCLGRFLAVSDAYLNENNVWTVNTEEK